MSLSKSLERVPTGLQWSLDWLQTFVNNHHTAVDAYKTNVDAHKIIVDCHEIHNTIDISKNIVHEPGNVLYKSLTIDVLIYF